MSSKIASSLQHHRLCSTSNDLQPCRWAGSSRLDLQSQFELSRHQSFYLRFRDRFQAETIALDRVQQLPAAVFHDFLADRVPNLLADLVQATGHSANLPAFLQVRHVP